jgi:hypothetical protein
MSDLLDVSLHTHGGLERWRQVESLDVRVSLTGGLYWLKGYPEGVPNGQITSGHRSKAWDGPGFNHAKP